MQNRIKNPKNSPFSHCPSYNVGIVFNFSWENYDKAFSLTWLVSMQNYWNKRKRSTTLSPWANTPKIGFFVPCRGTSAIIYF